jgi:hypothetical protein
MMESLVELRVLEGDRFQRQKSDDAPAPSTKDIASLDRDLKRALEGEVRFDAGSRALYATDGSNYRQVPIGVVIPRGRVPPARRRRDVPQLSRDARGNALDARPGAFALRNA